MKDQLLKETLEAILAQAEERKANPTKQPVVLSLGMGVDSAAILARWILEPESRDFDLEDLIVLTAQTGNEFKEAPSLCEKHLIPLMRQHNIRFVQIAKGGLYEEDGIVVLEDSTQPTRIFAEGHYKLADELNHAGTVPTFNSRKGRLCTLKFKGWVLDEWKNANLEGDYRHIIGFEANELKRAAKDQEYTGGGRTPEYPLIEWGWDRETCEQYLEDVFGEPWSKSCCTFCPFAKAHAFERYAVDAEAGAEALMVEHVSMALNPRMTLYSGKSLRQTMEEAGNCGEALALFQSRLAETPHTIYRIRRMYYSKGNARRSIQDMGRNVSLADAEDRLQRVAVRLGTKTEVEGGSLRTYLRRRVDDVYPTTEEFYVVAPVGVAEKDGVSKYDERWEKMLAQCDGGSCFDAPQAIAV